MPPCPHRDQRCCISWPPCVYRQVAAGKDAVPQAILRGTSFFHSKIAVCLLTTYPRYSIFLFASARPSSLRYVVCTVGPFILSIAPSQVHGPPDVRVRSHNGRSPNPSHRNDSRSYKPVSERSDSTATTSPGQQPTAIHQPHEEVQV